MQMFKNPFMNNLETNTYLLYGNITNDDLKQIKVILDTDEVYEARMKVPDPNLSEKVAAVVFVKYDIIDYSRDVSIKSILEPEKERLYNTITYLDNTGRTSGYIATDLYISCNDKLFSLLAVAESALYEQTIIAVDKQLEHICETARSMSFIKAMLDNDNNLKLSDYSKVKNFYTVLEPEN